AFGPDRANDFGSIGASSSIRSSKDPRSKDPRPKDPRPKDPRPEVRRREAKNVTPLIYGNSRSSVSAQRNRSLRSDSRPQNAQASKRSSAASANSSTSSTAAGQFNPPSSSSRAITRLISGELIGHSRTGRNSCEPIRKYPSANPGSPERPVLPVWGGNSAAVCTRSRVRLR